MPWSKRSRAKRDRAKATRRSGVYWRSGDDWSWTGVASVSHSATRRGELSRLDRRLNTPTTAPAPDAACAIRRRSRRVAVLILAIFILSVADLIATVTHLTTVGMVELNPIARYVIESTQSPWSLAAYKFLTLTICLSLLYRARRHVQAEVAAWACVAILAGLVMYWSHYTERSGDVEVLNRHHDGTLHERWLTLAE